MREKVALVFIVVLYSQLTCTRCMPKFYKGASQKRHFNNLRKSNINYNTRGLPIQPFKGTTKSQPFYRNDEKVTEAYNAYLNNGKILTMEDVPKTPLISKNKSLLESIDPVTNADYELNRIPFSLTLPDTFKNEAGIKKRYANTTEIKSLPKSFTPAEPFCLQEEGSFPEIEYPVNVIETWAPNYWTRLPDARFEDQLEKNNLLNTKANQSEQQDTKTTRPANIAVEKAIVALLNYQNINSKNELVADISNSSYEEMCPSEPKAQCFEKPNIYINNTIMTDTLPQRSENMTSTQEDATSTYFESPTETSSAVIKSKCSSSLESETKTISTLTSSLNTDVTKSVNTESTTSDISLPNLELSAIDTKRLSTPTEMDKVTCASEFPDISSLSTRGSAKQDQNTSELIPLASLNFSDHITNVAVQVLEQNLNKNIEEKYLETTKGDILSDILSAPLDCTVSSTPVNNIDLSKSLEIRNSSTPHNTGKKPINFIFKIFNSDLSTLIENVVPSKEIDKSIPIDNVAPSITVHDVFPYISVDDVVSYKPLDTLVPITPMSSVVLTTTPIDNVVLQAPMDSVNPPSLVDSVIPSTPVDRVFSSPVDSLDSFTSANNAVPFTAIDGAVPSTVDNIVTSMPVASVVSFTPMNSVVPSQVDSVILSKPVDNVILSTPADSDVFSTVNSVDPSAPVGSIDSLPVDIIVPFSQVESVVLSTPASILVPPTLIDSVIPSLPVDSVFPPTPMDSVVQSSSVNSLDPSTLVDRAVPPSPIDGVVQISQADSVLPPIPMDSVVPPTPADIIVPSLVDSKVLSTPMDSVVPSKMDSVVHSTLVDRVVAPTPMDSVVPSSPVDSVVQPTSIDSVVQSAPEESVVPPTQIDSVVPQTPADSSMPHARSINKTDGISLIIVRCPVS